MTFCHSKLLANELKKFQLSVRKKRFDRRLSLHDREMLTLFHLDHPTKLAVRRLFLESKTIFKNQ